MELLYSPSGQNLTLIRLRSVRALIDAPFTGVSMKGYLTVRLLNIGVY